MVRRTARVELVAQDPTGTRPGGPGDRLVVADGVVVLRHSLPHGSSWFTYEPDHNRWSTIGDVPDGVGDLPSAYGSKVFVPAGRRIAVYDVTSFRWSLLPRDPNQPRLVQRRVTATPYGPVVTGYDSTQTAGRHRVEPRRRGRLRRHLLAPASGHEHPGQ